MAKRKAAAPKTTAEAIKLDAVRNNLSEPRITAACCMAGGAMPRARDRFVFRDGSVITIGEIRRLAQKG